MSEQPEHGIPLPLWKANKQWWQCVFAADGQTTAACASSHSSISPAEVLAEVTRPRPPTQSLGPPTRRCVSVGVDIISVPIAGTVRGSDDEVLRNEMSCCSALSRSRQWSSDANSGANSWGMVASKGRVMADSNSQSRLVSSAKNHDPESCTTSSAASVGSQRGGRPSIGTCDSSEVCVGKTRRNRGCVCELSGRCLTRSTSCVLCRCGGRCDVHTAPHITL